MFIIIISGIRYKEKRTDRVKPKERGLGAQTKKIEKNRVVILMLLIEISIIKEATRIFRYDILIKV